MVREVYRNGFKFVPLHYPFNKAGAIMVVTKEHTVEEYQKYIYENNIEQADICMPDLNILKDCPALKHLKICPSYDALGNFDFTPLYEMPQIKELNCRNIYGPQERYISTVDYSLIRGLTDLSVSVNKGTLNYNKVETLKSLRVGCFKGENRDLTDLFCSTELDTLSMIQCGITSLNGIETSSKMQCLYLYYMRSLNDISALAKVKNTLKALRIENCPKIADFSVLAELENLELLELSGSNTLPNLDFVKSMKKLKTFVFHVNVQNGDLSPCLNLSYVYSGSNRKHYNLKDSELPKGKYYRGNEDIEEWRRLE